MAMELRQSLKLTQQLIMTPQLQQTIKLLQLSRLELIDSIQEEMEINPLLDDAGVEIELSGPDEAEPIQDVPEMDSAQALEASYPVEKIDRESETPDDGRPDDDFNWEAYTSSQPGKIRYESEARESPSFENFLTKEEDLTDHLMWQVRLSDFSEDEIGVCTEIILNLNDDGYLTVSVEEIAASRGKDPDQVEKILERIQEFDPLGVAARNVRECLLIQIRALNLDDSIVQDIVSDHLGLLENKNYALLSRKLGRSINEILKAVEVIVELEPRPGRLYHTEPPRYITPDIYIYKEDDGFLILLNEDGLPRLKINNLYKEALNGSQDVGSEAKQYIQEKLRSAMWLIRSIHQRQRTIYKVTESILKFQREFFEHGISHLKPLILKDVAEDIQMHESTISRVTTNKYAHTPQGTLSLKFFFNSAIGRSDGDSMASESVKAKIRQIVQKEDPTKPYSDKKIVEMLSEEGISIARRTVAKYREAMGILPSSKRKDPYFNVDRNSMK